ncbi:hypothetical protein J4E93_007631 [Alternaria ventricosa]|uniref:uncharacterized protein n=1 Tax=Alternaria ventricosa TaxID=1187951 RepID=UPI0020C22C98|nr:uncharacterized protein J4E93_007631 [Alternaria ventricosa]KAI4641534.1 hypothetical protein J4E93_007631 [Alternaria ventricosa]
MTTFHPFPRLPLELREQIWKDTVEPRTVDVRRTREYNQLVSSTPIPAILQSCREARNLGLYERVYFEVAAVKKFKNDHAPEMLIKDFFMPDEEQGEKEPEKVGCPKTEQRYVWLDFDIDMLDIGASYFSKYKAIAPAIKRLKFERENGCEYFYHTESRRLKEFINVEEVHIVCADGFWMWAGAIEDHGWSCAEEKLVFTDAFDGRVARGKEFEIVCRQMLKDMRLEATGEAFSTDDEES